MREAKEMKQSIKKENLLKMIALQKAPYDPATASIYPFYR